MDARGEGRQIFNIGLSEIAVVLLVAFLVVGPRDLPRVARWLGRQVRKIRGLIREVKQQTGWDEIEKDARAVRHDVRSAASGLDVRREVGQAVREVENDLRQTAESAEERES